MNSFWPLIVISYHPELNPASLQHLLISCFLIMSFALHSQHQISGTVSNSNKEKIAFVNVSVWDTSGVKLIKGNTTDENGYFQLSNIPSGIFRLSLQHIAYAELDTILSITQDLALPSIYLQASATDLSEVVVSAKVEVIEKVEDKIHFNVSSSPLNSGYDGVEILSFAPNIWVDGEGQISLRQATPVVLINGRKVNMSANELADYLRNISSENILRIEIQTNIDASQDAESAGGTINYVLKKIPLGFSSNLRMHYQFKAQNVQGGFAGLNFNYGAKKWNVYGNYNHSGGYSKNERVYETFYTKRDEYLKTNEDQDFWSSRHKYQLGFLWEPLKDHEIGLEVFGNLADYDRQEEGNLLLTNAQGSLEEGTSIGKNIADNDLLNAVFNYKIQLDTLGSFLRLISDFSNHQNSQQFNFQSVYNNQFLPDNTERNDFLANSNIFILQPEWNKHFLNGIKLNTGLKYTQISRDNDLLVEVLENDAWELNERTSILNYKEKVAAGYFTISQSFGADYFVKIGLRAEHTFLERREDLMLNPLQRNYTNWFPSFYLSKKLDHQQSISFSYNRGLNRPSFALLTNKFTKVNDFNYSTGNPDLQPEFRGAYDLTYQFKQSSFSLFLNKTSEAINGIYELEDQITTYVPLNNGVQRSFGGSFSRSGKINSWWFLSSNVFLFHRNFTTNAGTVLFPQTTLSFNLSNSFKLGPTTSIDLSGNYSGPRKDAFYEARATYQINALLKQSFFDKKLDCRLYLLDLFDLREYGNRRPFDDFYTVYYSKPVSRGIRVWMSYKLTNNYQAKKGKNKSGNDAKGRL